ncbi:MAG: hypothetical protein ACOH2R_10760 [Pseudomonas sp.]
MSNNDMCLLVGRNLLSFGQGISTALRADIMNCLLYAESSADQRYDQRQDWKAWIKCYRDVIQQKGSQITGTINPSPLRVKNIKQARALALNATGRVNASRLQRLWVAAFDTLMASGHAQTFFNTWFGSGRSETFQVVPCESDGNGGVSILLCGLQMTTTALNTRFSFWDIFSFSFLRAKKVVSGEMTVQSIGAAFRFTAQGYEPYRQSIEEYLRMQAQLEVIQLSR